MYLDLEVQADRYEVEQSLLQEMVEEVKENFYENRMKRQPRQMNEWERASLKDFNEQVMNSFKNH